jgi:hypothetical protein
MLIQIRELHILDIRAMNMKSSSPPQPLKSVMFKKKSVYYNTLLSGRYGKRAKQNF